MPFVTEKPPHLSFEPTDLPDRQQLPQAEAKFRALLESAPDAMMILDSAGNILLANSQTERLFGFERADLLGQSVELLVPDRFRGEHPAHRREYMERPRVRPLGAGQDLYARRKDGSEFAVEISLSPLHTSEETLVISSIRDVSERKRLQQALLERNMELQKAMEAKDRFLASMSHELRTPLNAIIGFTGTLLMKLPGPLNEEQEKQLQIVRNSGNHLLSLINDLLDVARADAGKTDIQIENVDCGEIAQEVLRSLQPAADAKSLSLTYVGPPTPVLVRTDRRALRQILLNLIHNAIKFTEQGGVRVEVPKQGGEEIGIRVMDSGMGIKEEDQSKLFKAFERIEPRGGKSHEGTGLGLHLSQKLAHLLGGRITVESRANSGATFTLYLGNGLEG